MLKFVAHENIARFEKLLVAADDPLRRQCLTRLIESERAHLRLMEARPASTINERA